MEAYLGEIRVFAGNFAPEGWSLCEGQLLKVAEHEALFSLLGASYGGNGTSDFGLPDLRCRVPIGQGAGPGLTPRLLSQSEGASTEELSAAHLPVHSHDFVVMNTDGTSSEPTGKLLAKAPTPNVTPKTYSNQFLAHSSSVKMSVLNASALKLIGGPGSAHDNMMPWAGISYIICLTGEYPVADSV